MRYVVSICARATVSEWLVPPAAASKGANDRQSGQDWLDVAGVPDDLPDTFRWEYPCMTAPV